MHGVALRSVPTSSSASITVGGPSAADIAAFGTSFVLDRVPISNNANLQTIGPRGEVRILGTSNSGRHLRRIRTARRNVVRRAATRPTLLKRESLRR